MDDAVTAARWTRLVDGVPHRDGRPFFSVGVNYHPSRAGCDYWREWDAEGLDADFRRMADAGLNTVRFFLFWADFEPEEGRYDPVMTGRLRELVALAERHGLLCLPSLLTIWMNGQLFDPPWRAGRDLWTDPEMAERQRAFVHHIAGCLREAPNVYAYDLGDEIIHVDPAASAAVDAEGARAWWALLAGAVREADPAALVLQANEGSAVFGDHAFRPEHAQPLDLVGLHGFPLWTPYHVESHSAPKATSYVPYLVRRGRAHAPVYVDELGSYGCDEATAARYLRAAAHSAFAAGAVGTAVWCWQDFTARSKPYALRPGERFTGLLDADGREKPAMAEYRSFARRITGDLAGFRPLPAQVGVFLPGRGGGTGYLASTETGDAAAFHAHLLLRQAHLSHEFTGDLAGGAESARYAMVICPSAPELSLADQQLLQAYVDSGGVLLYTAGELMCGAGREELFGVRMRDFTLRPAEQRGFTWSGVRFPAEWPPGQIPVIDTAGAETLAVFPGGAPALTRHRRGRGVVYYLNAPLEARLNAPYRMDEAPWHRLYAAVAEAEGIRPAFFADDPSVECTVLGRGDERCGVVVNHAAEQTPTTVTRVAGDGLPAMTQRLLLEPKGVHLARWRLGDQGAGR